MQVVVARRFRGPARSGNGGYTAGLLTGALGRSELPVAVRLRQPPPLEVALDVRVDSTAQAAELLDGTTVVATAGTADFQHAPVEPIPYDAAAATATSYAGAVDHPFPGCFVCGPDRAPGDGLRLFPGLIAPGRTAVAWQPDESVTEAGGLLPAELVWAALDCPGGWTAELVGRPMVLGTMTAQIWRTPAPGERCVITGRRDAADERRAWTSTSLYGGSEELLARAEAVWVAVDAAAFNQLFPGEGGKRG